MVALVFYFILFFSRGFSNGGARNLSFVIGASKK